MKKKKMGSYYGLERSQNLMMVLTMILTLFSLNCVAHISSEPHHAFPPQNPVVVEKPNDWSLLQNFRVLLGAKSFALTRPSSSNDHPNNHHHVSPSPSPSPSPSHSPSPAPTPRVRVSPRSERHAFHTLPRPREAGSDENGRAKRVLVAVLVSIGCFTLIAAVFLLLAWNKYVRHHDKPKSWISVRSNKRVSSHKSSSAKVSLNPGLDLFYLDSLGNDLERSPPQVSCCLTQTGETLVDKPSLDYTALNAALLGRDEPIREPSKPEFDDLSTHSTREITSVHDDLESVDDEHVRLTCASQEKTAPVHDSRSLDNDDEDDDDDDQSFHSLVESNSSNAIRLSNASQGSFSDALESFNSNVLPIKPSVSPLNSSPAHPKSISGNNSAIPTPPTPPPPPPLPPPRVNFLPSRSGGPSLLRIGSKASSSSSTLPSPSPPKEPNKTMQLNHHFASSPANNATKPGIPPPPCPPPLFTPNANSLKTPPPPPPPPLGKDGVPLPKLKPLHWDKVRAAPDQSMVWDKLRSSSFELDEEMMESLFGYNLQNTMRNSDDAKSKTPSPGKHVLEPKRLQNITILSKVLNVTSDQVCDAILQGNGLSLQQLEALVKMVPTKEEEDKLSGYQGDVNELGSAEKFVRAMLNVPFAFQRIEAMLYRETFEDEVVHLRNSFSMLEEACKELRSSRLFLKLLEAVLKTGNRMNVGTIRGGARAFKLDALLKLADIKGTDGKTNLLHFVVQEIIRSEGVRVSDSIMGRINQKNKTRTPEEKEEDYRRMGLDLVSGLSTELYNVKKTAAVDLDVLESSVSNLSEGLVKLRGLVVADSLSREEKSPGFANTMRFFVGYGERKIEELKGEEDKVMRRVREVSEYFHGNVSKEEANPLRIFVIVRDFLGMLDHVCKELRNSKMPRSPNPLAPFR